MSWSEVLVRAVRSVASPHILNQLCSRICPQPEAEVVTIVEPCRRIVSAVTKTITETHFVVEETPVAVPEQPTTIFNNFPGLAMHPLTFILILTALLILFSFLSSCVFLYKVRNDHKYTHIAAVNNIRLAHHAKLACLSQENLFAKLLCTKAELTVTQLEKEQIVDSYEGQVRVVRSQLQETQDDLARVKAESEHNKQSTSASQEIEKKMATLTGQHSRLQQELRQLAKEKTQLSESLDSLDKENKSLNKANSEMSEDNQRLKKKAIGLDEVEQQKAVLKKHNAELQKKLGASQQEKTQVAQDLSALSRKTESLEIVNHQLMQENKALQSQRNTTLAELDTANNKCKALQTTLSQLQTDKDASVLEYAISRETLEDKLADAIADAQRAKENNDSLLEQVREIDMVKSELEASRATITDKEKEIDNFQYLTKMLEDDKKSAARIHKESKYSVGRLKEQIKKLETEAQQKDNDLTSGRASLEDKSAQLSATKTSYNFILAEHDNAKMTNKRSTEAAETTGNVLKQVAEYLGISASHVELTTKFKDEEDANKNGRAMDSKSISDRGRKRMKMFNEGAQNFRNALGQNRRGHSIAGGETRLQVAADLPKRSKHLLIPEDNLVLEVKYGNIWDREAIKDLPNFKEVKERFGDGRPAYTPKNLITLIHNCPAFKADTYVTHAMRNEIDRDLVRDEHRDTEAMFWSANTKYEIHSLLGYRTKDMNKKEADCKAAATEALTTKYDNRLTMIVNQLEKYRAVLNANDLRTKVASVQAGNNFNRPFLQHITNANNAQVTTTVAKLINELGTINQKIHSGVLGSALDGAQGLRKLISKAAKEKEADLTSSKWAQ